MADADTPEQNPTDKREQMDAILGAFQQGQSGVPSLYDGQVPRRLHHYTTLAGLRGIVSTSTLWASDARFLNDSSELSYAAQLIDDVVAQGIAAVTSDVLRDALPTRSGFANGFEYGRRPFIACFCEEDDLLSQWRGYATGETGFSLGLDLSIATYDLPPNTFLRKVVYDPERQRQAVRDVVEAWLGTAEALLLDREPGLEPKEVFPYPAIWALQRALAEHHLCFKHPTFAEEREWRLIKLVDVREELRLLSDRRREEMLAVTRQRMREEFGVDMPETSTAWSHANAEGIDIAFRQSALGLVPYIELPIRDRAGIFTGRLPLWQVTQGPTPNPELSLESLAMYLESKDFGFHTEVKASGIPLRR